MVSIAKITNALNESWGADTAFDFKDWSPDNPARGQCVVSSLVVQDYLGGDLLRYLVEGNNLRETHYMNQLSDGVIVDTTSKQYKQPVSITIKPILAGQQSTTRKKRLADPSTARRYEILSKRVS